MFIESVVAPRVDWKFAGTWRDVIIIYHNSVRISAGNDEEHATHGPKIVILEGRCSIRFRG